MKIDIHIMRKILIILKEQNTATVNDIWFDNCVEVIRWREIHTDMLSVDLFHPDRKIMVNFYFSKCRINEILRTEREMKLNELGI